MCVKEGDTVEEGTLLFVLGDVESEELKAAQEALEKARISYQEQVLNFSKEYATDDQNVKTIREDLEKAIKERDENFVTDEEVTFAKGDLASMEANKRSTDFTLSELEALQTENDEYKEAESEYTAAKSTVDSLTKEIEGYEDQLSSLGGSDADYSAVRTAQEALNAAQAKWNNDYDANREAYQKLIGAVTGASDDTKTISAALFNQQSSYIDTYFASEESKKPDDADLKEQKRVYVLLAEDMAAIETASKALAQANEAANKAEGNASTSATPFSGS